MRKIAHDNDPALAKKQAERLGGLLWEIRDDLKFNLPDQAKAVQMALEGDPVQAC